jgi:hypothetical protein
MKHERKIIIILFLFGLVTMVTHAQETITTAGGNATGSDGSVSYTVGQIIYNTISGTIGSVAQGVQQPYEISVVTDVKNTEDINLKCLVYPNPTGGITKLVFESTEFENLSYRLFDINGVLMQEKKVESRETDISLEILSSSVYFLKVLKNNLEVKVFKIVKN